MKYLALIIMFLSVGIAATHAATTQTQNIIVNPGNAAALSSTTGLTTSQAQNIIDQASAVQVNPEITIPADSATISGSSVVIKGVATPNVSIDILIQPVAGNGGPIFGKAVSDRYGVWSYTLAPTLANGGYTIQATTQVGSSAPLQSGIIRFSVSGSGSDNPSGLSSLLNFSGNSFLIIVIAIIISVTFIVTVIILATVPYARSRRGTDASSMREWEEPELAGMNDAQWKLFVKDTEAMRHDLRAAAGHGHTRGHGTLVGA